MTTMEQRERWLISEIQHRRRECEESLEPHFRELTYISYCKPPVPVEVDGQVWVYRGPVKEWIEWESLSEFLGIKDTGILDRLKETDLST